MSLQHLARSGLSIKFTDLSVIEDKTFATHQHKKSGFSANERPFCSAGRLQGSGVESEGWGLMELMAVQDTEKGVGLGVE